MRRRGLGVTGKRSYVTRALRVEPQEGQRAGAGAPALFHSLSLRLISGEQPWAKALGYCASESGSIPLLASNEDPTAATTARFRSSAASSRIRKTASIPVQCAPSR